MKRITDPEKLILPLLYTGILAVLYLLFHNRYLAEYIDDAWTLSWAYNYFEKGNVYDLVFGYLSGDGGSSIFSRTYVIIYGGLYHILNAWGHRELGLLISTLFLFGGVLCWMGILKKLGYKRNLILWFAGIMLLLDLYFGMGHKLRLDALTFFLSSLALYLFVSEQYFLSALAGTIGMENHPYGFIFIMYILAYLFTLRKEIKNNPRKYIIGMIWFLSGLIAGVLYYLWLHYPWIKDFFSAENRLGGNAFIAYYFLKRFSWRHIPELIIILFSLIVFLKNRQYKEEPAVLPLLAASIITSILLSRGNNHYVVYLYPPMILLTLTVFNKIKLLNWLLTGLLIFQIPQYGYLFWKQREFSQKTYLTQISSELDKAEKQLDKKDEKNLPLFGPSGAWFAFYDREFYAYGYWNRSKMKTADWPERFLMIENRDFREEYRDKFTEKTRNLFTRRELNRFPYYDGSDIIICIYERDRVNSP